ncbi:unnamed protein product [Prorocentrum cordatum]|uniref:Uncharacterized protein n=1 Tax=Prorocentrum cordatum TaxID=2364126 RepID=A0ABN9WT75_9DINO|nr:unnamed protein product [Polarella glacialis]
MQTMLLELIEQAEADAQAAAGAAAGANGVAATNGAAQPSPAGSDPEALLERLKNFDPDVHWEDYYVDGMWDVEGLESDLELAQAKRDQAAAAAAAPQPAPAPAPAAAGNPVALQKLGELKALDPGVAEEDHGDVWLRVGVVAIMVLIGSVAMAAVPFATVAVEIAPVIDAPRGAPRSAEGQVAATPLAPTPEEMPPTHLLRESRAQGSAELGSSLSGQDGTKRNLRVGQCRGGNCALGGQGSGSPGAPGDRKSPQRVPGATGADGMLSLQKHISLVHQALIGNQRRASVANQV